MKKFLVTISDDGNMKTSCENLNLFELMLIRERLSQRIQYELDQFDKSNKMPEYQEV